MRHEEGLTNLEFRAWCAAVNRQPTAASYELWLRATDQDVMSQNS